MQTVNSTAARPKFLTRRQRLVVAACIVIALLVVLSVKLWRDHRAALLEAQKAPSLDAYQRAKSRGELTPEQQRSVNSNVEMGGAKDPIMQYFSLPLKERQKFLDDVIDRADRADKPTQPQDEDASEIPDHSKHLADAIPPDERARMGQFKQDLHDRRLARGLPDNGKFLLPRPQ